MRPPRLSREQVDLAQKIKERTAAWEAAAGTEHFPMEAATKLLDDAVEADLPEVAWFGLNLLIEITRRDGE